MKKFSFYIRKPRGPWPKENLPAFVLEQDTWNDYGFRTLYRLSYATLDDKGRVNEDLIGPVKILKLGQTDLDGPQITEPFQELSRDYCSVGTSLDYYERMRMLPENLQQKALNSLNDVVANAELEKDFNEEKGWTISLFRYLDEASHLKQARSLLSGDYSEFAGENLEFAFSLPGWLQELNFDFFAHDKNKKKLGTTAFLPERIAILVGRNGSGKSTSLARLGRVAIGTASEREKSPLKDLGRIEPPGIGFSRVISIAFSPFDSFRLPGEDGRDRQKIIKELKTGTGRFSFIGLRDIAAESARAVKIDILENTTNDADRWPSTRLKSIQQLTDEFETYLGRIQDLNRISELHDIYDELLEDSPLHSFATQRIFNFNTQEIRNAFLSCSTGHKIAALVVAGLLNALEPGSIVLFDEPETHLHPPLLAALMHALRKLLRDYDSYCIAATHSPVVAQESMARNISIIRRSGNKTAVFQPKTETFGESIGLITTDVFGLNAEATDYHRILDKLIKRLEDNEAIESLFFNGSMSQQARAYVMGRLLQRNKKEQ